MTNTSAGAVTGCNGTCAELKEAAAQEAASKVQDEYEKAAQATGKAVSTAGASAVAQAAVEVNAQVAKVNSELQASSRVQTGNALDGEEMRFGQLTDGADVISQVAKANFVNLGGDVAAFQVSAQLSLGDSSRLEDVANQTNVKFQEAHKAWEETRELAMEALIASNQAGQAASANLNSELGNLSASMEGIEEIAAKASSAEQAARAVQEKTRVVADITQQVQDLDQSVSNQLGLLQEQFKSPVVLPAMVLDLNSAIEEQANANAAVAAMRSQIASVATVTPAMQEELAAAIERADSAASKVSEISSLTQGSAAATNSSGVQAAMDRRQALEEALETLLSAGNSSLADALQQQLVALNVAEDPSVATARQQVASLQSQVDAAQQSPQPTIAPCSNTTVHGWQQELANTQLATAEAMALYTEAAVNMTRSTQALNAQLSNATLTAEQAQGVQTSLDNTLLTGLTAQADALQSQLTAAARAEELRDMIAGADCDAALANTSMIDTNMTPVELADRNDILIQHLDADIAAMEQNAR